MGITRLQVIETARSFSGVRFRHQGRDRNGVDCVGLLVAVGRILDYPDILDMEGYRRTPSPSVMRSFLEANMDEIAFADALPGDAVWMRLGGLKPRHAGILIGEHAGEESLIHASASGVRIQPLSDFPRSWFVSAFRLRGVTD